MSKMLERFRAIRETFADVVRVCVTLISDNVKTGKILTMKTGPETCPDVCPFKDGGGCYGENFPLALHWLKMAGAVSWRGMCDIVAGLASGSIWRGFETGDWPSRSSRPGFIDWSCVKALAVAAQHTRPILYTHHTVDSSTPEGAYNRSVLDSARDRWGLHCNVSANDVWHLASLPRDMSRVVTLPHDYAWNESNRFETPYDEIRRCPAEYADIDCKRCGICARSRSYVVGFTAHGNKKKQIGV